MTAATAAPSHLALARRVEARCHCVSVSAEGLLNVDAAGGEMTAHRHSVAVIGTGIMGMPIARNLADAGHGVTCWNRSRDKAASLAQFGISVADSPAAAANGAEFIIVMVSDGAAADHVLFNHDHPVCDGAPAGACIIMMSSIAVEIAKTQAGRLKEHGLSYIDAPVSGGEKGAIEATLTIMAGAAATDVERARNLLSALGQTTHVGPVGAGQLCKLANQLIVGVTIGAVAEGLALVQTGGGDTKAAWTALQGGFADSAILRQHGLRMIEERFAPGGKASIQLKDLDMVLAQARSGGLVLEQAAVAREGFARLCERGQGDLDHSALWLAVTGPSRK